MEFPTHDPRGGTTRPSPHVYNLAKGRRFCEIPHAIKARPQDTLWVDDYGMSALHIICYASTPSVSDVQLVAVQAILDVAPQLVEQPTTGSWTPLHLACKITSDRSSVTGSNEETLILKLIQARPSAVSCELQRGLLCKTPFHLACEANSSSNILRSMLRINPSLAIKPYLQMDKNSYIEYPLSILWTAIQDKAGITSTTTTATTDDWNKMELLLQAATMPESLLLQVSEEDDVEEEEDGRNDTEEFDVLKAACMVNPCPRDYLSFLIQRYANRLSWMDNRGYLPLHYAVLTAKDDSQPYTENLLEALLDRYPDAASITFPVQILEDDNNSNIGRGNVDAGRERPAIFVLLPLHFLLSDRRMTWHRGGVKAMVYAYPEALRVRDPRSNLVPFLASAIHATNSRDHLSTTYKLLRTVPEVIDNC